MGLEERLNGTTGEAVGSQQEQARELLREGQREASSIENPVARVRHEVAWMLRLSSFDPEAAAVLAVEIEGDAEQRARLLLTVATDRALRGDTDLEPHYAQVIELLGEIPADAQLRVLNSLSEIAMDVAERDRDMALSQLRQLVPIARNLVVPDADFQQFRILASALIGEALLVLDDPQGRELLQEAETESAEVPGRDPIATFIANALISREPEHALELLATLQDPTGRLEARLQAAGAIEDPALRSRLFDQAEEDAYWVEHYRGPEALVRMGGALAELDPERATKFFQKALAGAEGSGAQLRSLQWTGVASVLAPVDREWALRIFADAEQAALQEEEPVRRVTALVLIANEMAEPFPREAQEIFDRALEVALTLDAMWEYAHLIDVIFHAERSQYLDVRPALPILEKVLERLSDDDPRIPGVLGLPEVAQAMMQLDRARGTEVLERWFRAASASGDSDAMTQAALMIHRTDPVRGRAALTEARDLLLRRIDCPSMGEFSRQASAAAPDLVLTVAPYIPDRRERSEAVNAAAVGLYSTDPAASLELVRQLERPVDRSLALMRIVDQLLDTRGRGEPQPLMEDLP
jgi:hypothetical protein